MSATTHPLVTAPSAPDRSDSALGVFLLVAVYAIPVVVALRPVGDPVIDPDIWWHLRVGRWVTEHGAVPATDPFSRFGAGRPWVAYSWLYEVLVYRLYETFGLAGIVAYRVALSLAVVAALYRLVRRREARPLVAAGLTSVAVLALAPLFSERPWLFTVLFSVLTLDVVLDLRAGRPSRLAWALPAVFAVWANLHIQFVYGLFLLGLACMAPPLDALRGDGEAGLSGLGRVVVLTVLCAAATLANPYHARLYGVVWEYASQPGPFHCVNELRAPEFREVSDWVMLALGAAAVFALGRRSRQGSFEILLLAGAGALAFRSRRDLWFLVTAAVTVLVTRDGASAEGGSRSALSPRQWAAAAGMLATLILVVAWGRDLSPKNLRRKVAGVFPAEAAAVVAERGYEGPLFNDFNWGGYLIWSLPELPVALDGRTNLHGDERILRLGNTWAAGPGWRDDPDLAAAGVVVADAHSPLACVLDLDPRFRLVHEDAVARVFVKANRAEGPAAAGGGAVTKLALRPGRDRGAAPPPGEPGAARGSPAGPP